MLLSPILKEHFKDIVFKVEREKEFEYLALTDSLLRDLNCIFLDSEKFITNIKPAVTMVLTTPKMAHLLNNEQYGLCIVENPRELFFNLHNLLSNSSQYHYNRNTFDTVVGNGCNINPLASVAKRNVVIGNNVAIEEFAVIRENVEIGDNSIIRAGAIIGGQGFEFKRTNGIIMPVEHCGGVVIGCNVEIQYNSCIDRAVYPWDNTEIGDYTKIDNLVHIGHAVKVKSNVMIVANSGIGGRTVINSDTWIGFASTIINGITIGSNARANIGSVVTKSVPDNASVTGNFAIAHEKFIINLKESNKD